MLSFKGFSFTIVVSICIVLSAAVATSIPSDTPFVLNANEVPVAGGVLYIYGLNLGEDASQIKVEILDNTNGVVIECKNVTVVLRNSILSCSIVDMGTGRYKHIAVTVNGVSNDIKADPNMVFNRNAPKLHTLTYALEKSLVIIYGSNFGNNAGLVSVTLDGNKYPLVSVNDSFIVCSRLSNNDPPASRMAIVEVDGQGSTENLSVIVDASVSKADIGHIPVGSEGTLNDGFSVVPKDKIKVAWIIVGAAAGGAAISIFIVGLLVLRRRRIQRELDAAAATAASVTVVTDPIDIHVGTTLPPLTRDQSMVEIDLKEPVSASYTASRRSSVYEQNECMAADDSSSSSDSESMSPTSSGCSSPADSPCSSPMTSHKNDSEIPPESDNNNNNSNNNSNSNSNSSSSSNNNETPIPVFPKTKRTLPPPLDLDNDAKSSFSMTPPTTGPHARISSAKMRGMIRVPSSRIANRALDSPYFAKQGAFDSPKMGASFDSPNM